jgi:hypothetical protein
MFANKRVLSVCAAALLIGISTMASGADSPAGKAAKKAARAEKRAAIAKRQAEAPTKLPPALQGMTTLTAEQKTKIAAIHADAEKQIQAIRSKEMDDVMALLDREQKAEMQSVRADTRQAAKTKGQAPTTQLTPQ